MPDILTADLATLTTSGVRYAIGQRCAIVAETTGIVRRYWAEKPEPCRDQIVADVRAAVQNWEADGHLIPDATVWVSLLIWMAAKRAQEGADPCRDSCIHPVLDGTYEQPVTPWAKNTAENAGFDLFLTLAVRRTALGLDGNESVWLAQVDRAIGFAASRFETSIVRSTLRIALVLCGLPVMKSAVFQHQHQKLMVDILRA